GGLFETFWNGQTPGKRMMNIRVISVDGQPIRGWQAVLRNILRTADFLPMGYLLGIVVAMVNERFQRLGDLFAGTMVVVEVPQRLYGVMRVNEPAVAELAAALPAGYRVSRSLARALATYVQRRRGFPWARRIEIARHLGEPLRTRFNLPVSTSYDLLLCALYHRTFIDDRPPE
ncbi:MAG: RDD family protein, partial [Planctomycetes bacterium]|nr:RDD family protein [Planctomycetota bacterium]